MKYIFLLLFGLFLSGCVESLEMDFNSCQSSCQQKGYDGGECILNNQSTEFDMSIGACVVAGSIDCQNKNLCSCYCRDAEINNNEKNESGERKQLEFDSLEVDDLYSQMKSETRLEFKDEEIVDFEWMSEGEKRLVIGKSMKAWNIPVNGEMLLDMFFEMHQFDEVNENGLSETFQSQKGWRKDNIVCILRTEIFTERGEPSGDNLYQVICGVVEFIN